MYIHRLLDFLSFSQANERQMSEEIQNAALVAPTLDHDQYLYKRSLRVCCTTRNAVQSEQCRKSTEDTNGLSLHASLSYVFSESILLLQI